jgi:hypothetical protein
MKDRLYPDSLPVNKNQALRNLKKIRPDFQVIVVRPAI